MMYVSVLLPLALDNVFTYLVPNEWQQSVGFGKRVTINFNKKLYSALIVELLLPEDLTEYDKNFAHKIKSIIEVIDDSPIITFNQFTLWKWISNYYVCHLGEVMQAALPSGLKLSSETIFSINNTIVLDKEILTDIEFILIEAFEIKQQLSIQEINLILENKKVHSTIKKLIDKQFILVTEELKQKYKVKCETQVCLSQQYQTEEALNILFLSFKKSKKHYDLLTAYLQLTNFFSKDKNLLIAKKILLKSANANSAQLNKLIEKQIFTVNDVEVSRLNGADNSNTIEYKLSAVQKEAYNSIIAAFKSNNIALLHGVTGSGKTNIYAELIKQEIQKGNQVLYLVPEIALTTQLIIRLKKIFGNKVGVYHSKFNENERVETWNNLLKVGEINLIVGARSSLFLPFTNLNLIIIDEEHEASYKQQDPAPRYHARDAAIMLAQQLKVPVLLGSATPSVETYFNVQQKKYAYILLAERFNNVKMPVIEIVDIKKDMQLRNMRGPLTYKMFAETEKSLIDKKQVIFFQNRRGYVPRHECMTCGHIPHCIQCDVTLTYHKKINLLKCHYCGYTEKLHNACVKCNSTNITTRGQGTEKIEEELSILFESAKIARMDTDTTRSKFAFENMLEAIENKEIDILVGTQMIAKGLDFAGVDLVGIISADETIFFPDFRANERAFQLFSQVSGRAGRKSGMGKIFIQTTQPQYYLFEQIKNYDYTSFFETEIEERKKFNYPPFSRLVKISIQHKDINRLNEACQILAQKFNANFGNRILGPEFPMVSRIKNVYSKQFILKIGRNENQHAAKKMLKQSINDFKIKNTSFHIIIDVDFN